ncbi:hypothetical protein G6F22_019176 [Rhizopus arrhizus]|nr:hypothetical protein G6F22_019176 [Rhizopus arrhizus]KAG0919869.1 hypothetical protein G6F31_020951 [Rhizopus arrhizus]
MVCMPSGVAGSCGSPWPWITRGSQPRNTTTACRDDTSSSSGPRAAGLGHAPRGHVVGRRCRGQHQRRLLAARLDRRQNGASLVAAAQLPLPQRHQNHHGDAKQE